MSAEGIFCGRRTEKDRVGDGGEWRRTEKDRAQELRYIYSLSAPAALALSL